MSGYPICLPPLILSIVCLLPNTSGEARILPVGDGEEFQTITSALGASEPNDIISISEGVYDITRGEEFPLKVFHNLSFVRSPGTFERPVIKGGAPVFQFSNVEAAKVEGVLVTGSISSTSGAVLVKDASATFTDCVIQENSIITLGGIGGVGVVHIVNATATFEDCHIVENINSAPAALFSEHSVCSIRRSTISLNVGTGLIGIGSRVDLQDSVIASNEGTGLIIRGVAHISSCVIRDNVDGLNIGDGMARIEDTEISGNEGTGIGFGPFGWISIAKCAITHNRVGLRVSSAPCAVENCIIANNGLAGESGGGLQITNADVVIRNSVFYGGLGLSGGAIVVREGAGTTRVRNSVLTMNGTPPVVVDLGGRPPGEFPIIEYSLVEGGYPGEGNIDVDPLFVDSAKGDFRLQASSPCIDSASLTGPNEDILGRSRPFDIPDVGRDGAGAFDMGAYEFRPEDGHTPTPTLTGTATPIPTPTLNPNTDINRDGFRDANDLLLLLQDWHRVSGPSQ